MPTVPAAVGLGPLQMHFPSGGQSASALAPFSLTLDQIPKLPRQEGGPPGWEAVGKPVVLVLTYNRAKFLDRTLRSLFRVGGVDHYDIIISQDGDHSYTFNLAAQYAQVNPRSVTHWSKPRPAPVQGVKVTSPGFVAQHYQWALDRIFQQTYSHVIIVEDDMEFSFDFLRYFEKTAPLLDEDPTLMCVSSWNDNSRVHLGSAPNLLHRTSYFTGLGWLLKRETYLKYLQKGWPKLNHWDNWVRANVEMDCIMPSLPRNRNFGDIGASMNKVVFQREINTVAFYDHARFVDFGNLTYLKNANYEKHVRALIDKAVPVTTDLRTLHLGNGLIYLLTYQDTKTFTEYATFFKIWKQPRSHYQYLQMVELQGDLFLIADVRFCLLLPEYRRLLPSKEVNAIAAKQGTSCGDACAASGQTCSASDMHWLNNCKTLGKFFPCGAACIMEEGKDLPAYVSSEALPTHGFCVRKPHNEAILCEGMHFGTSRLCACVV